MWTRSTACCWGQGPRNCLEISGLAPAGRECSSFGGEEQEAGRRNPRAETRFQPGPRQEAEARAGEHLAERSGAALRLQAPHLSGARSFWRQLLADKGAKSFAQVLPGKGGLRRNKQTKKG